MATQGFELTDQQANARRQAKRRQSHAQYERMLTSTDFLSLGLRDSQSRDPRNRERSFLDDSVIDGWFVALEQDPAMPDQSATFGEVGDECKRIVRILNGWLPADADVYSMDEGKIAVEVFAEANNGFLLVCEPHRQAVCIVTVRGISRRARYEDSAVLPDGFLREGLDAVRGRAEFLYMA